MPTVSLYPQGSAYDAQVSGSHGDGSHNPLPPLLQTPSGLAILELQGTINLPSRDDSDDDGNDPDTGAKSIPEYQTPVGRLVFPDFDGTDANNDAWQKRVHLYVGHHQRLSGEVKKLPNPLAVIRRRQPDGSKMASHKPTSTETSPGNADELEIMEIVKYKIIFSSRPEPFTEVEA